MNSSFPADYAARVYAGVLGKIIGVYLGRPFEQWPYERIEATFGDVDYYVNEKTGQPLIVTDDDISGTFTFVKALADHGRTPEITAEQIGQTWLNYIIENRTILWWGGLGYAAEHTAFLRLKAGIPAPLSGSLELNGWQIAEEIGSQIFIEGWALVAPGNPALAADLARKAASVSHDREGIYGAQVIAVLVAQAFVETDINELLDLAVSFIPADSEIARCIADVRAWHAAETDWRITRLKIVERYGYERYGTNCPIVSNHAIVILGLLYGADDFSKALQITCNAAYDTDCNAANVGAILGVKNGLAGIDFAGSGKEWRGPVADRLFLPTADGGSCFTDALTIATQLTNLGREFSGRLPEFPKDGARFHFSQPGSVQGFIAADPRILSVSNVACENGRALSCRAIEADIAVVVATDTFVVSGTGGYYGLSGSPCVYPGQTLRAIVVAPEANAGPVEVALHVFHYNDQDELSAQSAESEMLAPGEKTLLQWVIPEFDGQPIGRVGLKIKAAHVGDSILLDSYAWTGQPAVHFNAPKSAKVAPRVGTNTWKKAWVSAVDTVIDWEQEYHVIIQNRGLGLISTGASDWNNYRAAMRFKLRAALGGGLAIRYGGLERYYGLMLRSPGELVLFKRRDGTETILAIAPFVWEYETLYDLELSADGPTLTAKLNHKIIFTATDQDRPFLHGGIALLILEGCLMAGSVSVQPNNP